VRDPVDLRARRQPYLGPRRATWDRRPRRFSRRRRFPGPRRFGRPALLVAVVVCVIAVAVAAFAVFRGDGGGGAATDPQVTVPDGPRLRVPDRIAPSAPGHVNTLRGLVDLDATLTANGAPVVIEPGGAFSLYIPQGATAIDLVATDRAGASTSVSVAVTADPAAVTYPHTVAVHVRMDEWADPAIHAQVVEMAKAGLINAVELDVKDETGEVGYASEVPLAKTVGAARSRYDARAATAELHDLGVRAIGRIVCFLDPITAGWAWSNHRPDMVVLDGAGAKPLANGYGLAVFTNLANPEIRGYQIDLAREAATLGFDDILYDYVRRPEGDLSTMTFTGLEGTAAVSVARFVAETHDALRASGATLGVSVFGIAATRPASVGQDVALLAPNVDYVAPMVYPSHWRAGEYGIADPVHQPAEIVAASLTDFRRIVAGSGTAMVPWLQDFSTEGVPYGPNEVRAQIDAATNVGTNGFLLWNPNSTYHVDALDRVRADTSSGGTGGTDAAAQSTTSLGAGTPGATAARFYRVKEGDTLTAIAAQYGVDISTVMAMNAISDPDALRVGQVLELPPSTDGQPTPAAATTSP
jgi:hypothetical protein